MNKDVIMAILCAIGVAILVIVAVELLVPRIFKGFRLLKLWWVSGQWRLPDQIQFKTFRGNQIVILSGRPVGIRGFQLLLSTDKGQQMVSAGAAVDTGEFWRTWKHLGGQAEGWVDADSGEPFDPTE